MTNQSKPEGEYSSQDHDHDGIFVVRHAYGAVGVRHAYGRRDVAVRTRFAVGDCVKRFPDPSLKRGADRRQRKTEYLAFTREIFL